MYNQQYSINKSIYKIKIVTDVGKKTLVQEEVGGCINWEYGINRYLLPYTKETRIFCISQGLYLISYNNL